MSIIRGEYWIIDGSVQFADGDVGDTTHEGHATDHVFAQFNDNIISLANDLDIDTSDIRHELDIEELNSLVYKILEIKPEKEVLKELGTNKEALEILCGGGEPSMYVMKYEGWIAVRSDNVEFFGFNPKSIVNGIEDILTDEGEENIPDEEVELYLYDHKSNKSFNATLADLKNPTPRPHQIPNNTYTIPMPIPQSTIGKLKSVPNKWSTAAKQSDLIGAGQDMWRGTSENFSFKEWLTTRYPSDESDS